MKAMVLAAGRATRLRPVTDAIAKPALSFFGRSILDRVLDDLADAGVDHAVVNLHHAPETVRALVAARGDAPPAVTFSDETRELLGTGGALVPVRAVFENEPEFLLVNGDCVHAIDLGAVVRAHLESGADCTLAVRPRGEPGFRALKVDARGQVVAWSVPSAGAPDERHFLSVQVVSSRLLAWLPRGGEFGSFTDWYPRAQADGRRFVVHETDAEWHALDSRELYLAACADWLRRRGRASWIDERARVAPGAVIGPGCAIHAGASVGEDASVEGSVLLENAAIGARARVTASLLGPWARVDDGARCDASLVAEQRLAHALAPWGVTGLAPLAGDASSRRYFRGRDAHGRSVVVMDCGGRVPGERDGFDAFPFTRWQRRYREIGLRVPDVLAIDREAGVLLLEDLGDEMLQHRVETRGAAACAALYDEAVAIGMRIAASPVHEDPDEDPLVPARLALEMDLLLAHLMRVPLGPPGPPLARAARALDASKDPALRQARLLLHGLCEEVHAAGELRPCHRDFHARNLVVCPDGGLAVLDFQDTRRGPRAYDLVSLAWDPYVTLPKPLSSRLVAAWKPEGVDEASWDREVRLAAGQRLLKAAGSYAFLSRDQGKTQYAQWLEPALRRARERLRGWPPRDALWRLIGRPAQGI